MKYSLSYLLERVRVLMDENDIAPGFLDGGDTHTLTLNEIITEQLFVALPFILKQAPLHLIGAGDPLRAELGWESAVGQGMCYFRLPDDFLRLVAFRMSDWDYAVHDVVLESDREYKCLRSRYMGIGGCPQRPKVALCIRDTGLYAECYSCTGGERVTITSARYLPIPKAVDGKVECPEKLEKSVLYLTAGLTAQTLGEGEKANRLIETSKSLYK